MSLRRWAAAAAAAFGYPPPADAWLARAQDRLSWELLADLERGIDDGMLVVDGYRFTLPLLGPAKGPYAWFSRSSRQEPAPNWEYFVQVALWLELRRALPREVTVGFEDDLMDVSVRRLDGHVDWFLEVKERPEQLGPLLAAMQQYADSVDLEAADRGNDPLRKAKYVVRQRPRWLSLAARGVREDYSVQMVGERAFRLERTEVPLASVGRT